MKILLHVLAWGSLSLVCLGMVFSGAQAEEDPNLFSIARQKHLYGGRRCQYDAEVSFPKGSRSRGLWEPEFSPDGKRLYFSNNPFGPNTDLYYITRAGPEDEPLPPFTSQTAKRLPDGVNSARSDRGISVIADEHGCDHIFFISERESGGDVFEAKQAFINGTCQWPRSLTPTKLRGNVNGSKIERFGSTRYIPFCVINVSVYADGKTMIYNGPDNFTARLHVARKHGEEWNESDDWIVQAVNTWADDLDKRNPRCDPEHPFKKLKCAGLLDPHVTHDRKKLYFVKGGDIYQADWNEVSQQFDGVKKVEEIERKQCPHLEDNPWLEGPATYTDHPGEAWLYYHYNTIHGGRIGGYRWPSE